MLATGTRHIWWDREVDASGRPIRSDVRAAAHQVWPRACARAQAVLGDAGDASGIIETSVAQISRYLDRVTSPADTHDIAGLLMWAFSCALRRHAMKLRRILLMDDLRSIENTLPNGHSDPEKQNFRLDAEKAAGHLSERCRMMLDLRRVGFDWKEIAGILQTTDVAVRAEFSREIKRVKMKLLYQHLIRRGAIHRCHAHQDRLA